MTRRCSLLQSPTVPVKTQPFPGHRRQSTAVEEGAATRPACKPQLTGADKMRGAPTHGHGCNHAGASGRGRAGGSPGGACAGPAPLTMNAAGLRGARPAAPCPSGRTGLRVGTSGRRLRRLRQTGGRAGAAGRSIARRRHAANPRLGFGTSGLAHRGPGSWGGAGAGEDTGSPGPLGSLHRRPGRRVTRRPQDPQVPTRAGGSRCGMPAPIQPGLTAASTERVTLRAEHRHHAAKRSLRRPAAQRPAACADLCFVRLLKRRSVCYQKELHKNSNTGNLRGVG